MKHRLVVAITGSTGAIYGYRLLLAASKIKDLETHLIFSNGAVKTMKIETGLDPEEVVKLATFAHDEYDFSANISSGSFATSGMIVAPCSMKTLSSIATGYEQNLVARAAMVTLKERRPLILMVRETPLNLIHLRNMVTVTEAGGIIMPPLPPFYFKVRDINELVDLTVGRALNMMGIQNSLMREWDSSDAGTSQD